MQFKRVEMEIMIPRGATVGTSTYHEYNTLTIYISYK